MTQGKITFSQQIAWGRGRNNTTHKEHHHLKTFDVKGKSSLKEQHPLTHNNKGAKKCTLKIWIL